MITFGVLSSVYYNVLKALFCIETLEINNIIVSSTSVVLVNLIVVCEGHM